MLRGLSFLAILAVFLSKKCRKITVLLCANPKLCKSAKEILFTFQPLMKNSDNSIKAVYQNVANLSKFSRFTAERLLASKLIGYFYSSVLCF